MSELLNITGLRTVFQSDEGEAAAVDGLNLSMAKGEIIGLVGESGCGKSVTALSIMRLIQSPPGRIVEGKILFNGVDLLTLSESDMRSVRGNDIAMIFQEPMTSLNPVFRVEDQIGEVFRIHKNMSKSEARNAAVEMLKKVGIPAPELRARDYPHQLSGGMRQRVMIAMALACDPELMLADEPTTALDVTIQAQILDLMNDIRERLGTGIILITHDLGVVAQTADRVAVMYAGVIVEEAPVEQLFEGPLHPYTIGLLKSLPQSNIDSTRSRRHRLHVIPGKVPDLRKLPPGCRFQDRCPEAGKICKTSPSLEAKGADRLVRCWMR